MNVTFAFCAIVIAGAVPDFMEPIAPSQTASAIQEAPRGVALNFTEPIAPPGEKSPSQPTRVKSPNPQSPATRPARPMNEGVMRKPSMPVPPTDPRAFSREDLPQPPTMNYASTLPNAQRAGTGPRLNPAGQAENSVRHLTGQKVFDNYRPGPGTSRLPLAGRSQQQRHRECLRGLCPAGTAATAGQPGIRPGERQLGQRARAACPSYPPAFLNYGSYYPAGR